MKLAAERGCRVGNCDVTIVAEVPRLAGRKRSICENIADLLNVDAGSVSMKATTNEGMGFVGRKEGIAVIAAVLMVAS